MATTFTFNYFVKSVDSTAKTMIVTYTPTAMSISGTLPPAVTTTIPMPGAGESLLSTIQTNAPIGIWKDAIKQVTPVFAGVGGNTSVVG